jgi:hypothetical protein
MPAINRSQAVMEDFMADIKKKVCFVTEEDQYEPISTRFIETGSIPVAGDLIEFTAAPPEDGDTAGTWHVLSVTQYSKGYRADGANYLVVMERKRFRRMD